MDFHVDYTIQKPVRLN